MAGGNAPAFEFLIEAALLAERASRDDWPLKDSTWAAAPLGDAPIVVPAGGHHSAIGSSTRR